MNNIKSIIVVGGGTAGWMCAAYLNKHGFDVTLIESPNVPIVGVGESCMPALKMFCKELGLNEEDWMPPVKGRHKMCIYHYDWLRKHTLWKHWFCFDRNNCPGEMYQDAMLLPLDDQGHYSFHIDATLFGKMLRDKVSIPNGVRHIVSHISQVQKNSEGNIIGLRLENETVISADFFVDCSGQSKLLARAVGVEYVKFTNILNNRAIAGPQPLDPKIHPKYTITRAASTGWFWDVALDHRRGTGYVFCGDLLSDDLAIAEYLTYYPNTDTSNLRVIPFSSEYSTNPLEKNVLTVGLSSGFIEPLEANSIYLIQYYIETFVKFIKKDQNTNPKVFNKTVGKLVKELYEFILTHYTLSQRDDTEYWRFYQDLEQKLNTREMVIERANQADFGQWSITRAFGPYNWYSKAKYFELGGIQ